MAKNKIHLLNIPKVLYLLRNTCRTLDYAVDVVSDGEFDETDLTPRQMEQINEKLTMCDLCGWWRDSSILKDGEPCKECKKEDIV